MMTPSRKRTLTTVLIVLVIVAAFGAWFAWYELFREEPEAEWTAENGHSSQDMRFMYGSIGGERDAGIPYWIVYVLPRVFSDKLPGPGGYASLGLSWEMGKDMPIGFTQKKIGFQRVAQNCAACHTASYRTKRNELPTFVPSGPSHTFNLEAFFRFTVECAKDPRFNSDTLMNEIESVRPKEMTWIERKIYRWVLIPLTKRALLQQEKRFAWIYQHGLPRWPDWGRGRDDAMNLTKYFLTESPLDDTLGPTDMPSIWNLKKYKSHPGTRMNLAGDSWDANSVIIDSALGLLRAQPPSNAAFLDQVHWLNHYLDEYKAPPFPEQPLPSLFRIDRTKVAHGREVFVQNCLSCHESNITGTVMPVAAVGTDRSRLDSWNKDAAIRANEAVRAFGIERRGLVEENPTGYVASFLDGIWLRAPYLHNGSVPSLRDLLKPAALRPQLFYRGYDVYDPEEMGFVSQPAQAAHLGIPWDEVKAVATPYDVNWRSNGNGGHEFGTNLSDPAKDALIEYLKTL
jgi:mono/diheme cytochrome c family protein